MAVSEQTPYKEYIANGVTTSFTLGFDCESKDHLIVLIDNIEPVVSTWSLSNGALVFNTAPANGKKITIQRNTPFSRTTDYQSYNNSFRPPSVNKDFDWIWLKLQELGVADWLLRLYVDQLHGEQKTYIDQKDELLQNNINTLSTHVDQQDAQLQRNIDNLKNYVDLKDGELRAYLMDEIRKQGVALDQLDEYYNYLMQRLAQIAVDKGWDASFVVDASGKTQQEINNLQAETNRSKLVSVFDFMTMQQFREWKADQENYNVTFALQAAINAANVYELLLPQGTYLHSGLYCDKNNFRLYSNGYARSILKSDNTAHVALHVAKNVVSVSGFFLDGVKLQGNVNTIRGIQLGDATKAVQFCNINNCMIDGFTKSDACDIYLGSVQELDIVNTMSWQGNIGLYKAAGGYGTSVKISGKAGYLGRHAKHGIKLDGQIDDIYVQDIVIEGNGLEAVYVNDTAFKGTQGVTLHLQNAYFEANAQTGVGGGVIYAKGASSSYKLHRIYTSACNFADNPNAPSNFKNIAGEYVILSASDSSNLLPVKIGLTNSYIAYHNNLTVSAGDITQQLKDLAALTGNKLIASGFDYIRSQATSPSKNVQSNFYSSITFPTTAVLSTDTTTLDDYREVSDFVPVVTGNGGTVSAATCKYTKIGNLVNFTIQLTTQNFTSTVGTTKVSLPHPQLIGTTAQFMNNQTYSGGFALVASQAVNLPTLASQGSVASIYITGSYLTTS